MCGSLKIGRCTMRPIAGQARRHHRLRLTTIRWPPTAAAHADSQVPSPNPGRPELDADARTGRARRLRHRVLPRALTGSAHDQKITVAQAGSVPTAAALRTEQETARRPP